MAIATVTGCWDSVARPQPSTPIPTAADLPASADDVSRIPIAPFPEGPVIEFDQNDLSARPYFEMLPESLPVPSEQPPDCNIGSVVILELGSGGRVDYGPCVRPASIEKIREMAASG